MKTMKDAFFNYLDPDVLVLSLLVNLLAEKYNDKVTETFKGRNGIDTDKLSEEEKKLLKSQNYLHALNLVGQYDNMGISESRGLTAFHETPVDPVKELKPSGEESCCIKLWSGTPEYREEFETKHVVVRADKPGRKGQT